MIEWLKPTGKINNSFSSFFERFAGFPFYQERLDFELETGATSGTWNSKLIPWTWVRSPDPIGGHSKDARPYLEIKEGWIEKSSPNFDIKLGNQLITWGTADFINPTDQWNPRDTADPINTYKLPMSTAKFNIHPTQLPDYSLEVLATPFFRPNRIPLYIPDTGTVDARREESRWLIVMPTNVDAGIFNTKLKYRVTEATYPTTWQAATRLQIMRVYGWDFSTSYFNGVEKTARFAFKKGGDPSDTEVPVIITLLPSFHRVEVFGFDAAGSLDFHLKSGEQTIGTRFEIAYNKRNNDRAALAGVEYKTDLTKDDFIHAVLGLDHTFTKKILNTVVYINGMYVHYQSLKKNEQNAPGKIVLEGLPVVDPFDNNVVLYVESRIQPTTTLCNSLVGSVKNLDGIVSPTIKVQFSDSIKSSLGIDIFFGRKTGFFGQFRDNNRINLNLTYTF